MTSANYVTIKKFCEETGYTPEAISSKIYRGDWLCGKEFTKAPDGRILISISGYHKWAETNIQASQRVAQHRLPSASTIEDKNAAKGSGCSPLPLT
ncbi:excisionase [Nitrosomonas ureae]|uniref:excisionase n=1 Tax=Nitrosomonas ureae TaxID=44577 RepID=UPI002155FC75|nr:excisionase [Nitrosomonas ureae]